MKRPVLTYLFFFCLVLITAACKDDSLPASSVEKEGGSNVYVSIVVNTEDSQNSRVSTPTPGEDGDGPQIGVNEENVVHDLNVFFFHTTDEEGLNTTDQSVNVVSIYFDQLTGSTTKYTTETKEIEGLEIGSSYNVLVIANLGESLKNITTLEDLREYPVKTPIVQTNHFVMASSETGTTVTIQATSKNNPTVVSANVERLAARVDCHWNNEYSVGNDTVGITQAMLVNKYTGGTYAFKRVTNSTTDFTIDYLGTENVEENRAANYVIDPKTLNVPQTDIAADYQPYFPTYNNWSATDSWKSLSTVTSTHNDVTYSLLDYTTENVVKAEDSENTCATYCTGIVFKAKYKPAGISTTDGTFYRYNGTCYASLTDIKNVIGDQSISDNNLSQFGITKYQDGICYYTYWIKHAEDGNDTTVSPMEYAIVRNNIYQINVTGINDIGTVTPTDYGLYLECTVADWISVDEITIDFSDNYDGEITGIHVVQNQKAVLVAYSQDNEVRDAQFSFTMNTPVGIGWTAHLTNPDDFEFIGDYHGVGGQGPVTLRIHPRKTFEEGVTRETDMYITIDTDNSPLNFNVGSDDTNKFPGDEDIIQIQQVSTIEYDNLLNNSQN